MSRFPAALTSLVRHVEGKVTFAPAPTEGPLAPFNRQVDGRVVRVPPPLGPDPLELFAATLPDPDPDEFEGLATFFPDPDPVALDPPTAPRESDTSAYRATKCSEAVARAVLEVTPLCPDVALLCGQYTHTHTDETGCDCTVRIEEVFHNPYALTDDDTVTRSPGYMGIQVQPWCAVCGQPQRLLLHWKGRVIRFKQIISVHVTRDGAFFFRTGEHENLALGRMGDVWQFGVSPERREFDMDERSARAVAARLRSFASQSREWIDRDKPPPAHPVAAQSRADELE